MRGGHSDYYRPGQTNLTRLQLVRYDEDWYPASFISIIPQTLMVNIYESMFKPTIYADVFIKDTANLLQNFPIIGQEYVEIEFETPGGPNSSYAFAVIGAVDKVALPTQEGQFYTLRCVSQEHLDASQKLVTKSYSAYAEDIIHDILDDYLDIFNPQKPAYGIQKPFYSGETKNIIKLTVPKLNSLKAIDMITQRAISKANPSSPFFFFESKFGFNFYTLNDLIDFYRDKVNSNVYTLSTTPDASKIDGYDFENAQYRNIEAYKLVKNLNTYQKVQGGAIKNVVRSFDFTTKGFEKRTFDIRDNDIETTDGDGSLSVTRTMINKYEDPAIERMVPTSQDIGTSIAENMGGKTAAYAFLDELTANILVAGDSAITVGEIVELKLPDLSGTTERKDDDQLTSGNYLVTKVRHMISGDEHKMVLQITKLGVSI